MKKVARISLIILSAILLLSCVLIGCNNKSENYVITVKSMGGALISDAKIKVASGSATIAEGTTGKDGTFSFKAKSGEYVVSVTSLPKGYILYNSGEIKTSASSKELTIRVVSSIIKESAPKNKTYKVGDVMYDFSVTTPQATPETYTLSDLIETQGKYMVLLNFWNTSCVPCVSEMPGIQLAYNEWSSYAEVLAINVPFGGSYDRDSAINSFAENYYTDEDGFSYSIQYPLVKDPTGGDLASMFQISSIPVTIIIDRYGVLAYREEGSMDRESFQKLFEHYCAADYSQDSSSGGEVPDGSIMAPPEDIKMPDSAQIEEAINGANFNSSYYPETETDDAEYSWPWILGGDASDTYLMPSNSKINNTFATIYTNVTISEEDVAGNGNVVLAFDFKYECEDQSDYFYVIVNDNVVYTFTGTENWKEYDTCYALVANEAGEYRIGFLYTKDPMLSIGADTVRIKNIRLMKINDIAIDSLDMSRDAATHYDGSKFVYATAVKGDDGFYHEGDKNGPYILANLMDKTNFNEKMGSQWSVSDYATNGSFKYSETNDKTDAIIDWAQAANNSELYGLTVVNDELKELLNEFAKSIDETKSNENSWLEFCIYFDHYGTDKTDTGINCFERNPVRGLKNETAFTAKKAHEGAFADLKNIPEADKNKVVIERIIVPRGIKYSFTPDASGAYVFRSQGAELHDTMSWLYDDKNNLLIASDEGREDPDEYYNSIMTYYLEKGKTYYAAFSFFDVGNTGEFTFTIENLGESAYIWEYAARGDLYMAEDTFEIQNILNIQPVYKDGKYYNAKTDENGNYIMNYNQYVADTSDPIYVNFTTSVRFFENGSIEDALLRAKEETVTLTVSQILGAKVEPNEDSQRVDGVLKQELAADGTYESNKTLQEIKGSELTDDDWKGIIDGVMRIYGEYIDEDLAIDFKKCEKVGDVVTFLKDCFLDLFDFSHFVDKTIFTDVPASDYIDYTDIITKAYEEAKKNTGDEAKGKKDAGSVQLTSQLVKALDLFARRISGYTDLNTDYLRLCAHYRYVGPYKADN